MKYHINPETGQVNQCRARLQCRFMLANEHYATAEDARAHYEKIMAGDGQVLSWLLTSPKSTITGPEDASTFTRSIYEKSQLVQAQVSEKERHALLNYSQFGFEYVNAYLRDLPLPTRAFEEEKARAHAEGLIASLERVFTHEKREPKTVYRYVCAEKDETAEEALARLEEKGVYEDPAYMSTSASIDAVLHEVLESPQKNMFVLEIATDRGVYMQAKPEARPGQIQSLEHEILLPKNMKFQVVSTTLKQKVAFGGLKDAFVRHAHIFSANPRRWPEKDIHRVPVVRLVQL